MNTSITNLRFRDATQEDLATIVAIYNSTVALRTVTADTEPVTVESRQAWFDEHTSDKRPLWVVEDETHNIIGWVSFQDFYGRPAYAATAEISIYLDTVQRGKGLGATVLQHCLEQAPAFGINTLIGFIFSHNHPSIQLFQRAGFDCWGTLPKIALLDDTERSLSIFGKRLV